jgi:hypothetical protein
VGEAALGGARYNHAPVKVVYALWRTVEPSALTDVKAGGVSVY